MSAQQRKIIAQSCPDCGSLRNTHHPRAHVACRTAARSATSRVTARTPLAAAVAAVAAAAAASRATTAASSATSRVTARTPLAAAAAAAATAPATTAAKSATFRVTARTPLAAAAAAVPSKVAHRPRAGKNANGLNGAYACCVIPRGASLGAATANVLPVACRMNDEPLAKEESASYETGGAATTCRMVLSFVRERRG